jgi:simple sugar transport system ATP-binding protein
MRGIEKRFGSVHALRGADFTMGAGGIHALLGENGAGKSTLMHVLYGLQAPDAGTVAIGDREVRLRSPRDAMAAGIGFVHQHFSQVPAMTVAENVALGATGRRYHPRAAAAAVRSLAAATGLELDPTARVTDLAVGMRQRLEIVKALARDTRVLVLDEPTGALAPREVDDLFAALRRLAQGGVTVALITHKLREVAAIADTVTVLRNGATVLERPAAGCTAAELADAMVGQGAGRRERSEALEEREPEPPAGGQTARLEVAHLRVQRHGVCVVEDVSLVVRTGEIVGVAGVEGNGQRELLRALAGFTPCEGLVVVGGNGRIGFIPEDRQREGLVLGFDIADNLALGAPGRFWRDRRQLGSAAAAAIADFGIRTPGPHEPASRLSGGNQQKVVLARELGRQPALVIAENPTRGLDLRSTADVHERLRRAARQDGAAVLLYSTDLDEVLTIADRVAVMAAGRWTWVPEEECSRERVGLLMLGAA